MRSVAIIDLSYPRITKRFQSLSWTFTFYNLRGLKPFAGYFKLHGIDRELTKS